MFENTIRVEQGNAWSRAHLARVLDHLPVGGDLGEPVLSTPNEDGQSWPIWRQGELVVCVVAPTAGPNLLAITVVHTGDGDVTDDDVAAVARAFCGLRRPDVQRLPALGMGIAILHLPRAGKAH